MAIPVFQRLSRRRASWQTQGAGNRNYLNDLHCTDKNTGWAVGYGGMILKHQSVFSPLAGFTWSAQGVLVEFLNASIDAAYFSWDFGDGQYSAEQSPQHTYPASGDYLVKLSVSNDCGGTSTFEQTLNVTVGTTTPPFLKTFALYPNPAGDYFTLQLNGEPQNTLLVDIYTSTGQRVYQEILDFQSGSVTEDISCRDFPTGVYWIRVANEYSGGVLRIIIQE